MSRDSMMELRVNWRPLPDETDHDSVSLEKVEGIQEEFAALEASVPGAQAELQTGGYGKGASATGVALVVLLAERVLTNLAALIDVGSALREAIDRIRTRRGSSPELVNAEALAAIAASHAGSQLAGSYYAKTIPLNVSEGVGSDARDVWLTCFDDPDKGLVHAIFMSPSGLLLGYVRVPVEMYFDGQELRERDETEVARWWAAE